jgi:HD domain
LAEEERKVMVVVTSSKLDRFTHFLRLRNGGDVKRYHTFPIIGEQKVSAHTFNVLLFIMQYHPEPSMDLIKAALYHDLAEYDTGDTPANVKWKFPMLLASLENAENEVSYNLGIFANLDDREAIWLKVGDTLEYLFYALEQRLLGNINMDIVFTRGCARLLKDPYAEFLKEHIFVAELVHNLKQSYISVQNGKAIHTSVL